MKKRFYNLLFFLVIAFVLEFFLIGVMITKYIIPIIGFSVSFIISILLLYYMLRLVMSIEYKWTYTLYVFLSFLLCLVSLFLLYINFRLLYDIITEGYIVCPTCP